MTTIPDGSHMPPTLPKGITILPSLELPLNGATQRAVNNFCVCLFHSVHLRFTLAATSVACSFLVLSVPLWLDGPVWLTMASG